MTKAGLAGVRVAVLRPAAQAHALGAVLAALGAEVIYAPLIRIAPPSDVEAVRRAAASLGRYDWVVFTSANAVHALAGAGAIGPAGVQHPAGPHAWPAGTRCAVVGEATATAVRAAGWPVDLVPERFGGAELAAALTRAGSLRGRRVLFPRARAARRAIPETLRAAGAVVDEVECYHTVPDAEGAERLAAGLLAGNIDALAFTSPSQVESFRASGAAVPPGVKVAAIGPATAAAARSAGLAVDVVADPRTGAGLADALARRIRTR